MELAISQRIKPLHLRKPVQFHEELIQPVDESFSITVLNGFPHFIARIFSEKGPVVDFRIFLIISA